jgi:hypothetical protein
MEAWQTREAYYIFLASSTSINEEHQLSRRYVRFDLDALYSAAATTGEASSHIIAIDKIEGGFSKAFLIKWADRTEVIAKILCRITSPPLLVTASEVGVLEYSI